MKLEVNQLTKKIKGKDIICNVTYDFEEGIYTILGNNKSGKTTFLRLICGIYNPTCGEVKFNGKNIIKMGENYREILGYFPQNIEYPPNYTARDFLQYIASLKGIYPKIAKHKVEELLKQVCLDKEGDHKIKSFSVGMRKRLGIAQALLDNPLILILDEPVRGTKTEEKENFKKVLSELNKNMIVIISENAESGLEFGKLLSLKDGKLISKKNN